MSGTKRGVSLDAPMAALVAGAVGFVAYAMPDAIFTDLVVASGLPQALEAAQPPLGTTARLGVIGASMSATFVLVWALLRALSAPPGRRAQRPADDLPKLRRADAHPDAPARRLLAAGAELGEPEDEDALQTHANPVAASDGAPDWEWEGPRFQADSAEAIGGDAAAREAEPPSPHAADQDDADDIDALTRRFEAGLLRRHAVRSGRTADEKLAPTPGFATLGAVDARLQSALDDLQRLANRPD